MASYPHTSLTVERLQALDAGQWRLARTIVADFVDAHMECGLSARVEYDLDVLQAEVMAKVPLHADCVEAGREHYARFSPRASSDSGSSCSWALSPPTSPSPAMPAPSPALLRPARGDQPPGGTSTAHARALARAERPAAAHAAERAEADAAALRLRLAASEEANRSLRAQLAALQAEVARTQLRADKSERERAELEGVMRRQRASVVPPMGRRVLGAARSLSG